MDAHNPISAIPFFLSMFVALVSWFYSVYEWAGIRGLRRAMFHKGLVVINEVRPLLTAPDRNLVSESIQLRRAAIRFVAADEVIFLYRLPLLGFDLHTPFPLKCSLRWTNDGATFVARIPVGPMVFMLAIISGWLMGGLAMIASGGYRSPVDLAVVLLPPLFIFCVFYLLSLNLEKRRAWMVLCVVEKLLQKQTAARK